MNLNNKMHADEVDITKSLVQRLVADQFPHWAKLPIESVESAGTSNAIFRLGNDMSIRLPRIPSAVDSIGTEFLWLPKIAPHLPFAVPTPLAIGKPTEDYPWCWTVCKWVEGRNPIEGQLHEPNAFAIDLARFVMALHEVDFADGPESERGKPLAVQNEEAYIAIEALHGKIDTKAALAAWEDALQVPRWSGSPVWIHGDLMPGNLLIENNRLSAVIDFSCLGVGDPASDLITAWNLLPAQAREIFRKELQVDDATWARGKGWALSMALIQLPYYEYTNPVMAANARHTINEVLSND
ncbi:MAG: aminoglycoside phosphotransferase family protein [Legionellales bacterium]|nr:aminoglycoside phosphotransferase family protein [Legionellales bacterium]